MVKEEKWWHKRKRRNIGEEVVVCIVYISCFRVFFFVAYIGNKQVDT